MITFREGSRRGTVLLQTVLLLFGMMGLAALVIDLGLARHAQLTMQVAADAGALEGLRGRDPFAVNPTDSDLDRRNAASRAVGLVFDEDADLTTAADRILLGAGPTYSTGVAGSADPQGGLLVGGGPYLPAPELNTTNAPFGDLVGGSFTAVDPLNPGNPNWHAENALYLRADFLPASSAEGPTASAFLARLRRTNNRLLIDSLPGVSSSGPALPYLFGLGTHISAADPEVYDPRRDGITVRATAIADARPVLAAATQRDGLEGLLPIGLDLLGLGRARVLAFESVSWSALPAGGAFVVRITPDAAIVGESSPALAGLAQPMGTMLGVGDLGPAVPTLDSTLLSVDVVALQGPAYVALYTATGLVAQIDGFASVRVDVALPEVDVDGNLSLLLTGVKLASRVADGNASAHPSLAPDASALFDADAARELLMAPVLVR